MGNIQMTKKNLKAVLDKIGGLHSTLEGKIDQHETFFRNGYALIGRLQPKPPKGYDNNTKDTIASYIIQILTELYHVEGNNRGHFRKHFREHVVVENPARFKEQIDYLKNWVDFATANSVINDSLKNDVGAAIIELNRLQGYANKKDRVNESRLIQNANNVYNNLYDMMERLRAYTFQTFHVANKR